MIKVYVLPVATTNGTQAVAGIEYIHDALLSYGTTQDTATLVMDATPSEHTALSDLALEVRDPTPEEILAFEARPEIIPPSPDYIRACEILSQSPPAMTMIEIWELLRIIGKRLGYRFGE